MKIHLLFAFASIIVCQTAILAQQEPEKKAERTTPVCPQFSTPVIEPTTDESSSSLIKPDNKIDYKILITDPCIPEEKGLCAPVQRPQILNLDKSGQKSKSSRKRK